MLYTILATVCILLLLVFGAYHLGMFQKRSPYTDQTIGKAVTISNEWAVLTPDEMMKPTGDDQEIGLYLEEPFTHDLLGPPGVRMPDGSIILPEVELIDIEGNAYKLKFSGARGRKIISFTLWGQLKGREYRSVRLRAGKVFKCKEVLWTTTQWKYLT
ncbi:MAG: hypothetical protein LC785_14145 [Acidobacteria bacterium]|nr:hypothetical protein [Acidobacteriota bacterium]MCA1643055.1 hypothetical protein [Acidobacteriota bacterium]